MNTHSIRQIGEDLSFLVPKHVVSLLDFDETSILKVFALAKALLSIAPVDRRVFESKVVATMFFQPSTRTRLNFEAAAGALGCSVIGFSDAKTTRAGDFYQESVEDVVRFTSEISDILVLRHFDTGIARKVSKCSRVPMINAGDGYNEHPSQALGDLWTMHKLLNGVAGRSIGLLGDPNIRSLRSIAFGLARLQPARISFLLAPGSSIPTDVRNELDRAKIPFVEVAHISELLGSCDLVETIGVRHPNHSVSLDQPRSEVTPEQFRIDANSIARYGPKTFILHPGPRTDEIDIDVDCLENARYFAQARNGLFVRMALLWAALARN